MGKVHTQSCSGVPSGRGMGGQPNDKGGNTSPSTRAREGSVCTPRRPVGSSDPLPGGGPGLATHWGLFLEKLKLGKKGLLPGPRHAHCAKTESPSRSLKPTINQGITISFAQEFAAFIGQAYLPQEAHQISTKEGSGTRVTPAPATFLCHRRRTPLPSRLLHTLRNLQVTVRPCLMSPGSQDVLWN